MPNFYTCWRVYVIILIKLAHKYFGHFFIQVNITLCKFLIGKYLPLNLQYYRTLVGNMIADLSDVVGASPIGAVPTKSSFPVEHMASTDWAKATTRRDENKLWDLVCFMLDDWR